MKTVVLMVLLVAGFWVCEVSAATDVSSAHAMVDKLARLEFDQLGHPQIQSDSIHPIRATSARPHKLLILPVRFPDTGYDRFAGNPHQDALNRRYFQQLLFEGGASAPVPGTLSHYYQHQSRGLYHVTGDIFPLVALPQPQHYYGRPVQSSDGSWRNDERASELVVDALAAAYTSQPDFPWRDYDQWDPTDFDGDGNRDEADGYLDHFVVIVAGKGQAACQGLYNLSEKLNVNAPPDAFFSLSDAEQTCADRLWPHRFSLSRNLGRGPEVSGKTNARGGVDLGNGLWVLDYNMQSEYTDVATFIHEFGHSLGLPDIYARETDNSTASWDAMSSTTSPLPQELSAWSRMVLGWLKPCVVLPPTVGGARAGVVSLKTMNAWPSKPGAAAGNRPCDAAMVILPPKFRTIELGSLSQDQGRTAMYSGQGNGMHRSLSRQFDFREVADGKPLLLSFDTWFEIEAEWDYLYVEVAAEGAGFQRIIPLDKSSAADKLSVMPSTRGHEGPGSSPGFTGRSGDLNGDGKVETAPDCDPNVKRELAEDKVGSMALDPCDQAQWVRAEFDLSQWRGRRATVRFSYFTDAAAVEAGALIDNVEIEAINFHDDFELSPLENWQTNGFTPSTGSHRLAVPHYYLLEYRDPFANFTNATNYDSALTEPVFQFFPAADAAMTALNINYRPGVVMWYYNGEYLWSQNEPAETGPGRGFLLVVDANPQEYALPSLPSKYFKREGAWTRWDFDPGAQSLLHEGYVATMCFQRRPAYYSNDVTAADRERCRANLVDGLPPMEALVWHERPLMYGYTLINELLPGDARAARKAATTLFDLRLRKGKTQYRLYDGILRNLHSADAPFALTPFANGIEFYQGVDGVMTRQQALPFAPVSEFTDARPNRYQNPGLPFGGADIPDAGFSFQLQEPAANAPVGSRVTVKYAWR